MPASVSCPVDDSAAELSRVVQVSAPIYNPLLMVMLRLGCLSAMAPASELCLSLNTDF